MKIRVVKQGMVEWGNCIPLQPDNLKTQTSRQLEKLKTSIKNNGFASPFLVWENKGKTFILDGHHRISTLKLIEAEGTKVPPKLPAVWIDAKDKKEAKKLLLIYISHYAKIDKDGVNEFIADLNLDELMDEIEIPEIDFSGYELPDDFDGEPGEHDRKDASDCQVTIGEFRATIPIKVYDKWVQQLNKKGFYTKEEIIEHVKKTLALA